MSITRDVAHLRAWPIMRVAGLYVCVALLYLPGVTWGLPSEYSVAINSDAPYDSLEFISLYGNPNVSVKYPAVEPLLSLPLYAGVVLGHKLAGNLSAISNRWPYGFRDPYLAFSHLIIARNMLSLAAAVGVLLTLAFSPLLRTSGKYTAVALLATSGVFTYYSRAADPDVGYLFWWGLSLVFLARYVYALGNRRRTLVLAAIFSALAIGTKDQAAGLVLGSGIIVLLLSPNGRTRSAANIKDAALFTIWMLAVYFVVAVLPQPFRWIQHVKLWLPSAPNVADYVEYPATPIGYLGLLQATLHSLVDDLSVGTLICAVLGLAVLIWRRRWTDLGLLVIPIVAYCVLIVIPIRFVYERFMLPAAYTAVVLAGIGIREVVGNLPVGRAAAALVATGACLTYQVITGYVPVTQVQLADVKSQLSEHAPGLIPPGSEVLFVGRSSLRTLPNSDFYTRYAMMLPQGVGPPGRYEHVFSRYDPDWKFVLSDEPLDDTQGDLQLVRRFAVPQDIRDRAAVPISLEYYLYRR